MDQKLKRKWVAALRSGKYKQGKNRLKTKHGFCCLGVLRDVDDPKCTRTTNEGLLAPMDAERFGLTTGRMRALAGMNDGTGDYDGARKSFKEIADYIARNL